MKPTQDKDLNAYIKSLVGNGGCSLEPGKKHIKLRLSGARRNFIIIPTFPSDLRVLANIKSKIRRLSREGGDASLV